MYKLKNNRRIKQRAPLTRSITPFFMVSHRKPLQTLHRPLALVFRHSPEVLPQHISYVSQPTIQLGISVSLQNDSINIQKIKNEKPGRVFQRDSVLKAQDRHYIKLNSLFYKINTKTWKIFRHHLLNQSYQFMDLAKPDKHYPRLEGSVMLVQRSGIPANTHRTMHLIDSAITRLSLRELAVTGRRARGFMNADRVQTFKRKSNEKMAGMASPKSVIKPIFLGNKKSSNKSETMPVNTLLKGYKRNKEIEDYIHYSLPRTSKDDQVMNARTNSSSGIKRTESPVQLDYRQKPKPTLMGMRGRISIKVDGC